MRELSEGEKESLKIIEQNAQESGNPHAFYSGMVFGLAHAHGFIARENRRMAIGMIEVLLNNIDEIHFKERQQ